MARSMGRAVAAVGPDQRLQVLEQKLAIYVHGTASGRRNPALDVLVGRVPDARLAPLAAAMASVGPPSATGTSPASPVVEPHRHGPARATTQPIDGYPTPAAGAGAGASAGADAGVRQPAAMVVPVAAVRMAAVARAKRASSPWLAAGHSSAPRLHLRMIEPPRPSLWRRLRRRLAALLLAA